MAHNPHAHLQREVDSLRKQLIQERDQRRFDDSLFVTHTIKQAEERVLERCIVECMEEANGALYSEEERIAILTTVNRLKDMRSINRATLQHDISEQRRKASASLSQQLMDEYTAKQAAALNQTIAQGIHRGTHVNNVWVDEMTDVSWSNVQSEEFIK